MARPTSRPSRTTRRLSRRVRWRNLLLAALAGGALAGSVIARPLPGLAFAFPLWMLSLLEAEAPTWRRALALGWAAGTGCNLVAFYWIPGLLRAFAGFPLVAALPVAFLLALAQGLVMGVGTALAEMAHRAGAPRWLGFPAALTLTFSLAPALFPWRPASGAVGWLHWAQPAELGGPPLLDLLCLGVGAGAWAAFRHRERAPALFAAACLLLPPLYGAIRLPEVRDDRAEAPSLRVGVVQPNIGIHDKHDPRQHPAHLRLLRRMTADLEELGADLVVWPESAYPYPFPRGLPHDLVGARGLRREGVRGPLLVGAVTRGRSRCDRWNSVIALERSGRVAGVSDKVELLAFGETVPLWEWLPPLQDMFPCPGLKAGDRPRALELAGARIGVLNCYEDVLAEHARTVALEDPHFLVNVTNDAWFGETREPHLHQLIARQRTIETRRDLVRAVNTGVSAHVAATGATLRETDTWERTSFMADVRLVRGETPWVRLGDTTTPTLYGALLAFALRRRRRAS